MEKIIYPPAATSITRLEENMTYDNLGNVETREDTAGRTTSYEYDSFNRLIKITDALTNETEFEYNLRSQLEKVKDALNQEYVFTYDPLGRVLSQTRAGTSMTFEYDAVGNRTKRTDHNSNVTNYTYDNLNRLTSGSLGTYTYDDVSQMLTATNSYGTVSFTYDNRGRVDTTTDVFGKVLDYDYDADGNRTLMKLDGNSFTSYTYDDAGRLESQTNVPESAAISFGYDIADRLTSKVLPNGITTVYEYDDMSRLKRIKDQDSGGTLTNREYTYNTANQIASIILPSRTKTYTYDNIDRLTAVTDSISGSVESYAYDAVGNRTSSHLSSTYTYDPFNRLVATDTETYTYDNNGSMATRTDTNGTLNLFHDGDGRFMGGYKFDGSSFEFLEYRYDALGRRIYRSDPWTLPSSFTYDGDDMLLLNWGGSVSTYQNDLGIDNSLSVKLAGGSGSSTYTHRDHLGTPIAGSTSGGVLTGGTTIPDSFGNGVSGFTGREYDSYAELQYSRHRMYDPKLGRFISEDPIGFAGGDVNLHAYVWNNPLNWSDPMGLDPFKLPANPSQLPPGWTPDTTHQNPNGSRWISPSGDSKIEFEPGRPGKTGWKAKDHWHKWVPDPKRPGKWVKDEAHHEPGEEIEVERSWCPIKTPQFMSQPTMEEIRLQIQTAEHMEKFWGTVLVGSAIGGVIIVASPAAPALVPLIPSLAQQRPAFGF